MSPGLARRAAVVAVGAGALGLAGAQGADGRMSILYERDAQVREIVRPGGGVPGLTARRGAYRQAPGKSGVLAGRNNPRFRIGKVAAADIERLPARAIAARLRAGMRSCVIRGVDHGCRSGLVAIDEVGRRFRDGTRAGARLAAAMRLLGRQGRRVHIYLAPAVTSAIAAGRGRDRNLGRNGRPLYARYLHVMQAAARAGGVWLEMYHVEGPGRLTHFTAREWRRGPSGVVSLMNRYGRGSVARVHVMFTGADARPAGAPRGCGTPMACAWRLADTGRVNRRILRNGPGAYNTGRHARDWLRQYNRRLPVRR